MINYWTTIRQTLPTLLSFSVLLAVGWWGHRSGWTITRQQEAPLTSENEQWCAEHGLYEADCLLCRKPLAQTMRSQEPASQVVAGEEIRFAQVATPAMRTKANITTQVTATTLLEPTLQVPGETHYEPNRITRLSARLSGTILQVYKHLGDRIAAGEVIAVIDCAAVGQAKSALMRALADQATARAQAQRMQASQASGFRTVGDAREALGRLQALQIAVFDAEQVLLNLGLPVSAAALAELEPAVMATQLRTIGLPDGAVTTSANGLPILAPRAGMVTQLSVVAGEAISADSVVAVVADTSQLKLQMAVAPQQVASIKFGQKLRFTSGGIRTEGQVTFIAPSADEMTRLVTVIGSIANTEGQLRALQVGDATIVLNQAQPVVMVPASAVQFDGPTAYVFVERTPTIFRGLPVHILATTATGIAIDRIIPGDVVVITGTDVLKGSLFQDKFGPGCACGPKK